MLIRQAQVAQAGGWLVLRAQVSSQGKETECFYSVPERFADFADAVCKNIQNGRVIKNPSGIIISCQTN